MKNYIKLFNFLEPHKKLFFTAVVIMFFASFFEAFQTTLIVPLVDIIFTRKKIVVPNQLPDFIQHIVDKLNAAEPNMQMLVIIALFYFLMLVLRNGLVFGYSYLMNDVSQRIIRDIRDRLYSKIQSLSLDYFSDKRTGELISRITYDAQYIENAVSYAVIDLFKQSFMILFWVSMAFTIDSKASVVIFFIFPMIGIPMGVIGKRLKKISKGTQEKFADINAHLLETISGIKLVKAFCTEDYETKRFVAANRSFYKLRMQSAKRVILISPITEIVGGICGISMMIWFGSRLLSGDLSFGVFGLFFASIMQIISPVKKIGNVNALVQQAIAANDRIYDVFDQEPSVVEKKDAVVLKPMTDRITLKDIHFQYNDESGVVLKGIDLEIKKGELVAVVGPTGTGKTTLVNLIPRFYDPLKGQVSIDGIDLKDVTFTSLRGQMGIVTQETILFNDTVRANIAYGKQDATPAEIEQAAQRAYAHDFIKELPKGYDTFIGDRGFRLSGGEKQRLSIARAILRNAPILILDEATSALDSESEKFVQDALDVLMQGRTVIAIAHRLSTIKKADKIVVLEKGKVVGIGKHEQLLQTCPLYNKLHTMQFQV